MLPPSDAKIVETQNLIDAPQVEKVLMDAIKEYFPDEIKNK